MRKTNAADPDPKEVFLQQVAKLWPAIKGSVAPIRKPCIRPNCPACARGDKHQAFILSFTHQGKRRCMYVPKELVPVLQRALANGRQVETLLYQLGPTLLRQQRQQRGSPPEA
jgi:hypothetical protein